MLKALAICTIVVSPGTNGNVQEKYDHELAHCNGWEHPIKVSALGQAYVPPKEMVHPFKGKLIVKRVSLAEARKLCGGHFACQWFN